MAVVVDTSFLVEIERETLDPSYVGPLLKGLPANSVVSVVSLMELRMGALSADSDARKQARERFAQHLRDFVRVLSVGEDEAMAAAEIMVSLRRSGQRIGERDLLIAATAIANGHSLITLNRSEFERVPGLTLLDLPDIKVM